MPPSLDPTDHPRLKSLLQDADEAVQLLQLLTQRGESTAELRATLDTLYRDLGRQLHDLLRQQRIADQLAKRMSAEPAPGRVVSASRGLFPTGEVEADLGDGPPGFTEEVDPTDETEGGERWYTEEVDLEGPPRGLFDAGDPLTEDIPLSGPPPSTAELALPVQPPRPRADEEPEETSGVTYVGRMEIATPRGTAVVGGAPGGGDPAAWVAQLRDLLDLLELPASDAASELAVEAARVQWATAELESRLAPFPDPVRQAFVGLLASRARHLQERLDEDVGPRLALERLRRYRKATGLAPVVGLLPRRGPELGHWADDAGHWWTLLDDGLRLQENAP